MCTPKAVLIASVWTAACALAAGCAMQQVVPPDLDLSMAAIVLDASEPVLIQDGSTSQGVAVGVGMAGGAGTGIMVATLGCIGAGPFYPICVAAILPAAAAIGVFSGAMVGGLVSETADASLAKTAMLKTELAAASYPHLLAQQVQKQARERSVVELPLIDGTALSNDRPNRLSTGAGSWWIEVALTKVSSGKAMPDQPFGLRAEGRLKLRRSNEADAVYETKAFATSEAALTTAEWSANGAEAAQRGLDQCLRLLADKLLSELVQHGTPVHSPDTDGLQTRREL